MKKLNQSGSHVIAAAVVVLVIGVIGFTGYKVSQHSTTKPVAATTTSTTVSTPASIQSKADLTQTAKSLDASSADINSSVNSDALNTDLSDLQ